MESSKSCETFLPQVGMLKILLLLNCKKKAFQSEIVWVPCKFFCEILWSFYNRCVSFTAKSTSTSSGKQEITNGMAYTNFRSKASVTFAMQ